MLGVIGLWCVGWAWLRVGRGVGPGSRMRLAGTQEVSLCRLHGCRFLSPNIEQFRTLTWPRHARSLLGAVLRRFCVLPSMRYHGIPPFRRRVTAGTAAALPMTMTKETKPTISKALRAQILGRAKRFEAILYGTDSRVGFWIDGNIYLSRRRASGHWGKWALTQSIRRNHEAANHQ